MEHGKILKVAVLKDGRLGIFPDRPDPAYQYIYREAAGVYWNQELGCFQSTVPREWDYPKWYSHIVAIVKGVGLHLRLAENVVFESVDSSFCEGIAAADREVQEWIEAGCPVPEKESRTN